MRRSAAFLEICLVKLVEGNRLSFAWAMRIWEQVDLGLDQLSHTNVRCCGQDVLGRIDPK